MLEDARGRGLVDYVAMDVKAPLDERYDRAAGVSVDLDAIRASIDILLSLPGDAYEFRTTLVPGLVGEAEVVEIARALGPAARRYVLQTFVPEKCLDTDLERAIPYTDAVVVEAHREGKDAREILFLPGKGRRRAPRRGGAHLVARSLRRRRPARRAEGTCPQASQWSRFPRRPG